MPARPARYHRLNDEWPGRRRRRGRRHSPTTIPIRSVAGRRVVGFDQSNGRPDPVGNVLTFVARGWMRTSRSRGPIQLNLYASSTQFRHRFHRQAPSNIRATGRRPVLAAAASRRDQGLASRLHRADRSRQVTATAPWYAPCARNPSRRKRSIELRDRGDADGLSGSRRAAASAEIANGDCSSPNSCSSTNTPPTRSAAIPSITRADIPRHHPASIIKRRKRAEMDGCPHRTCDNMSAQ